MSEPLKVIFGILSTYERNGWHHPSITQFFADLPFKTGYGFRVVPVCNFVPAASGRNVFCRNVRDTDADWICMIDNDMALPENLLDTLKDVPKDAGIVVPAFYLWDQTTSKLVLCWGVEWDDGKERPVSQFGPGFHELTKCGTGVIFIRPSVLCAMNYPFFRYLYNDDQGMAGTEDIQFCLEARKKGFKIYGNASINVGHYHSVELSSLWDWGEKTFGKKDVDSELESGVVSSHLDAASPAVPQVEQASPASAT
jgi:hypothetical protein